MADTSVGQIGLDLVVNRNSFDRQMNSIQGLAKKAGASLAAAFATKKIIDFGKECLELGSDLAEVQNVVDVTFPSMSAQVDKFAKSAITSFGLSETMAKKFTGTFGSMAKSFGFSEKQAYDMGSALTGLAGDVASFYNISQDEAYTKLKSVFTGETESLKDLGVVMTQTALDSYAMANGFGKTTSAMSEAEKVALRYAFVQDKLSAASGDFARTSGSWANQVRILKLQFDGLKATIGQGLINLFTPIIKVVNIVIGKLATLANAFKAFTELITGNKSNGESTISLPDVDTSTIGNVGAAASDAGTGMEDASGAADNMAASTKKAGNAAKKAGNAAKKAAKEMRSLMGFDKINKISENTDDASDRGTGSGKAAGLGSNVDFGSLAKGETVIDKAEKKVSAFAKRMKELAKLFSKGFSIGFGDSEKKIKSIQKQIQGIGKSLKEIFTDKQVVNAANNCLDSIVLNWGKIAGAATSIGLTIADNLIGGIDRYLSKSKDYIKDRIVSMLDAGADISNIKGNFAAAFADIFSVFSGDNAKNITASFVGIFSDALLGIRDLGMNLGRDILDTITAPFIRNKDAIKTAIDETLAPIAVVLETVSKSVRDSFEKMQQVYNEHIAPMFASLKSGLAEIAGALLDWYTAHIAPVLDELAAKFVTVWNEHIQPVIDKAIEFIGKVADMVRIFWEQVLQPFILWVIENILPIVAPILEELGTLVMDFVAMASDRLGCLLDAMGDLIDFFTGVFTGDWEKASKSLQKATDALREASNLAFTFIKDRILTPFDNFLKDVFEKDWTESFGEIGNVLNGFFDIAEDVWEGVKTSLNGIITFVQNVFTGNWEKAWQGVQDIFGGIFEGLVGLIKSPLNGVIGLLNGVIDKINGFLRMVSSALSFDIGFNKPDWLGGGRVGFKHTTNLGQIGHIPYLANGGYVRRNTPQLAMIGDNRHQGEIVSPEDKLRQMAADAVREAGSGAVTKEELERLINNAVLRIVAALANLGFYVDGEELGKAAKLAAQATDARFNPVELT